MDKKEAEVGALQNVEGKQEEEEQVVNPWEVSAKEGGKIDYDKLIEKFGCQRLNQSLIDRVEHLTSRRAHVFLRRGVFFAHRYHSLPPLSVYLEISVLRVRFQYDGWTQGLHGDIGCV